MPAMVRLPEDFSRISRAKKPWCPYSLFVPSFFHSKKEILSSSLNRGQLEASEGSLRSRGVGAP
ncbi:MAG: hypothetical protein LBE27_05970, partial [Deltaproteobacteria bacterium]|nr:hypothetical protein [Deltaproteobacteria bacterium]